MVFEDDRYFNQIADPDFFITIEVFKRLFDGKTVVYRLGSRGRLRIIIL